MTIQKALKSGKPFKRKRHTLWFEVFHDVIFVVPPQDLESVDGMKPIPRAVTLTKESILATDWEIES